MNRKSLLVALLIPSFLVCSQQILAADIRVSCDKILELKSQPLDVALSLNGKWLYVLSRQGDLLVYSGDGKLAGRVVVGEPADQIRTGPRDDTVLLMDMNKKAVRILTLDFIKEINIEGCPSKGPKDAPVVITEFTEFQCSHCAAFAPVLRQVHEKYPEQVRIVFKNYPLKTHQFSVVAAAAALAAERQGVFWRFHDRLFENGNSLDHEKIQSISMELGLDQEKFMRDMRDPDIMKQIRSDVEDAQGAGLSGVPAVFVNGRFARDRSFNGIIPMIEEEFKRTSVDEKECPECTEPTNQ
jgi:thiol-disulfide isomerase/thioredoxin